MVDVVALITPPPTLGGETALGDGEGVHQSSIRMVGEERSGWRGGRV